MKRTARMVLTASGVAAVMTGAAALSSYLVTRLLMKVALDRQRPRIWKRAEERVSGAMVSPEILGLVREAGEQLAGIRMETVEMRAKDGTRLIGHWYPCSRAERVVIAMHGWRSSWNRDFGLVAGFLHEHGCDVLFAEQRGQNNSGGEYMGFGLTERYDCLEWIRLVGERCGTARPVYLCGISMGATTVMMAAGLGLPDYVHGIIADCGFTSPERIWKHVASANLHISYRFHRSLIDLMCRAKIRMSAGSCSTADALQHAEVPVLFVHGAEDRLVPVEMTYENYLACASPKRLLIVPGAGHGMSYLVDPGRYEAAVQDFWAAFDGAVSAAAGSEGRREARV